MACEPDGTAGYLRCRKIVGRLLRRRTGMRCRKDTEGRTYQLREDEAVALGGELLPLDELSVELNDELLPPDDELPLTPDEESELLDELLEELSLLDDPESLELLLLELPDELLPLPEDELPLLLDDELPLPEDELPLLELLEQQSQQQQPAWWLNCQSPVCFVRTPFTSRRVITRV